MSTWIYVITRNHCLNSLAQAGRRSYRLRRADSTDLEGENGLDAHLALEKAESFENIYRTISSILTPMEVRVLWLHYACDLTLASITRQLLLSNRSGAKAFIVSAKRKLKLYFHNRGIAPGTLHAGTVARAAMRNKEEQRAFAA